MKIGVIDTGINPNLPEFAGKIDPASRDVYNSRGVSDEDGHGTAVSAVAAAARNGSNTLGIAFDATIVSMRADEPGSCATEDGCAFYDSAIAQGIDAARLAGAKVINLSLGGSSPGPGLLAAMGRAVNAGIVLVISAGNDGEKPEGANADPFALTPAQQFPGQVIIAGSVGVNTPTGIDYSQISTFSNRAGSGAQWYLMAAGYRDRAPDHTGTQFLWSGTSFAAPAISGAVALLAQAFPNLTGSQIINILFLSADDLGATGTDPIYGRGRLNLERAFQPIGATSLAGTQTPVGGSDLPPASGDANGGTSFGAIILDGFDRAFVLNLAKTLRLAPQDRPLARSLRNDLKSANVAAGPISLAMTVRERHDLKHGFAMERLGIGPEDARQARLLAGSAIARIDDKTAVAFGFAQGAKAMERRLAGVEAPAFLIAKDVAGEPGFGASRTGSMAVRREFAGLGFTLSGETGKVWQEVETSATGSPYRWTSVSVDKTFGSNWLSAGISRLEEKETLLGGRMAAILGGGGSTTLFADLEARRELGNGWTAGLTARRGWTQFNGGKFETGAYALDISKEGLLSTWDKLAFRLAQPLRVEKGGFAMMLPTSYDYATATATNSLSRFSLTPKGREIDAEVSYGASLLRGNAWLGGNLFYRRQPGHIAAAKDDVGAAVRFMLEF